MISPIFLAISLFTTPALAQDVQPAVLVAATPEGPPLLTFKPGQVPDGGITCDEGQIPLIVGTADAHQGGVTGQRKLDGSRAYAMLNPADRAKVDSGVLQMQYAVADSATVILGSGGGWCVDSKDTRPLGGATQGEKGDTGAQGIQGEKGEKGDPGSEVDSQRLADLEQQSLGLRPVISVGVGMTSFGQSFGFGPWVRGGVEWRSEQFFAQAQVGGAWEGGFAGDITLLAGPDMDRLALGLGGRVVARDPGVDPEGRVWGAASYQVAIQAQIPFGEKGFRLDLTGAAGPAWTGYAQTELGTSVGAQFTWRPDW